MLVQQTQADVDDAVRSFFSMLVLGLDTAATIDLRTLDHTELLQDRLCSAPLFALACADWEDDWRINLLNKRMIRQSVCINDLDSPTPPI
jgi:hypothetical protein